MKKLFILFAVTACLFTSASSFAQTCCQAYRAYDQNGSEEELEALIASCHIDDAEEMSTREIVISAYHYCQGVICSQLPLTCIQNNYIRILQLSNSLKRTDHESGMNLIRNMRP